MARHCKCSVLVCLALLCQVTMCQVANDRDNTSSSSAEGLQSEEGSLPSPAIQGNGRDRTDIVFRDRPAQKFAPVFTNSIQPARTFGRRRHVAMQNGGNSMLPLPDQPSFLADSSRVETAFANTNRNVADVVPRVAESAGSFGSSVSIIISENAQPSGPINRQSQANNYNPTRPSSTAQNSFPIVDVQPNQSNGNSPPVQFYPQFNYQSGLNIPVASGGVEPPSGYVPRDQLFVLDNNSGFDQINPSNTLSSQGSFNGGGSPNLLPSRNTNTNFGLSTGSFNGGGLPNAVPSRDNTSGDSPNAFPSRNTNNFGSTGTANSGGSPGAFPFQNTNNNIGSSTGSSKGGSSQQPNAGSVGSPAKGSPGSTNQYPNDKFPGGQAYPEIVAVVNAIQEFTLDLLATFKVGSQSNVVYSPVSISSLLSLLTLATNGNSKREIENAIFPLTSSSNNDHHSQYETILERLNHRSQGMTISTSSRLFLEESVNISRTFADGAMKHYNCSVSLENFSRTPKQTLTRVNSWIEEETRGKITDFISEPFRSDTKFVAINTIYFDGKWATPFSESSTSEKEFDTGNEVIQIPMMTNVFETPHYYSKELNVDVISLPYSRGEFAMIIILPRESPRDKSIIDLEKQLNTTTIESLVSNMTSKSVSISLPKMKLAMKTSLVKNLVELRIRSMFSPSTADLSSLTDTKPLWVGEFLHEAVMEVTEEGTVAAAVSGVFLGRMGGIQYINVNKPAIIFIRDMVTRVPLFWTRLVKPERVPESGEQKSQSQTKF